MISEVTNEDNMLMMGRYPDKFFDLAIVDPPYGIKRFGNRVELSNRTCSSAKINQWDVKPDMSFFDDLFRVSKFQIIWGANNFTLPESEYFIVWNKEQTVDNFASAEYAWTNVKMPAKVYTYSIHKEMAKRKENGGKIHPTQKPYSLYYWLLQNYAKPGDKIIDTHLGSGSSRIAAYDLDFDFYGCELDKDYYEAQEKRFKIHIAQQKLFSPQRPELHQTQLF